MPGDKFPFLDQNLLICYITTSVNTHIKEVCINSIQGYTYPS